MPLYLYVCDATGEERLVEHGMREEPEVQTADGLPMRRAIRQAPRVNWNGDRASDPTHPAIKELVNSAPRRREEFERKHEQHENRTKNESSSESGS